MARQLSQKTNQKGGYSSDEKSEVQDSLNYDHMDRDRHFKLQKEREDYSRNMDEQERYRREIELMLSVIRTDITHGVKDGNASDMKDVRDKAIAKIDSLIGKLD